MNQEELDQATWWVLQRIKEKQLEKPDSNNITYDLDYMDDEPAILASDLQEATLSELRNIGAISFYQLEYEGVLVVGTKDYSVNILQPKFDQLYKDLELKFTNKIELPDPSSFSDELKSRIVKVITVIKQKHELDLVASGANTIRKLKIPEQDFLASGVSRDELDKILMMLSKKLMFTPYLKDKEGIGIGFAPAVPAQTAINVMSQYANKLEPKLIKTDSKIAKNTKVFPHKLVAGTKWEHIIIQFLDDQNVRIIVGKNTLEASFIDMGFEDGRTGKPNKQWALLLILARHQGEINATDTEVNSKIKKTKELLVKQLKSYFPLDYDPFWPYEPYLPYKEKSSYQIKLQLIPANSKPVIVEEEQDEISREVREMFEM